MVPDRDKSPSGRWGVREFGTPALVLSCRPFTPCTFTSEGPEHPRTRTWASRQGTPAGLCSRGPSWGMEGTGSFKDLARSSVWDCDSVTMGPGIAPGILRTMDT